MTEEAEAPGAIQKVCGIVRPIADMDGYSAQHWSDVHEIINEALEPFNFKTRLVSDADEIGVIQGRIVKNLYDDDLVVCDVSGKNPNVMFELGMRLAFDKPTIVIKDDITSYSFDTSPIEHIGYPRDLRYSTINEFKERLGRKAKATADAPTLPNYKSFLQHFGPIMVPAIEHQEVPADQYILSEIRELRGAVSRLSNSIIHGSNGMGVPLPSISKAVPSYIIPARDLDDSAINEALDEITFLDGVVDAREVKSEGGRAIAISIRSRSKSSADLAIAEATQVVNRIRNQHRLFD